MPKKLVGTLNNVPHVFYRTTHCFGSFRTITLIYFWLVSVLVGFVIYITALNTVDKLSFNMPTKSEELQELHITKNISAQVRLRENTTTSSTSGVSCQPLHYIPDAETRPVTALVSFPGSGNTWLRYLIQQSTGAHTGSEYLDKELLNNGFPGEGVLNASVAVVKTHQMLQNTTEEYQKAVLLIRHPKAAIQAYFNHESQGHTGCAPKEEYDRDEGVYWRVFVQAELNTWEQLNLDWIHNFTGPLQIVQYDQLLSDLGPTLRSLVEFLDLPLNETAIQCTIEHSEGLYHRKPCINDFDPFSEYMNKQIAAVETMVFEVVKTFIQSKK